MKQKFTAIFAAGTVFFAFIGGALSGISASAAEDDVYTLRFVPERTIVTTEELAAGDVTIPASIYITGSTENRFAAAQVGYASDNDAVYFRNITTGDQKQSEKTTYTCSLGTFETNYIPYCFGGVTTLLSKTQYTNNSPLFTTDRYLCDYYTGADIYSAGAYRIAFTYTETSTQTSIDVTCDVIEQDDGTCTYTYYNANYAEDVTCTIHHYDPTTPEGEMIAGNNNSCTWLTTSITGLTDGIPFLGATSDEFPFFTVDIVISQGTEPGEYHIDFEPQYCELTTADYQEFALEYENCTIEVLDVEAMEISRVEGNEVSCFASYDTNPITAETLGLTVFANVTSPDSEGNPVTSEKNVTELVDVAGVTPADLFDQRASNGYYSSNVPLYYDGEPLYWSDGTAFTQKIMVGVKGDINYDGAVDPTDAYSILTYYANSNLGVAATIYQGTSTDPDMETLTYFLGDIDTCSMTQSAGGALDPTDAYAILVYYANTNLGVATSWDTFRV